MGVLQTASGFRHGFALVKPTRKVGVEMRVWRTFVRDFHQIPRSACWPNVRWLQHYCLMWYACLWTMETLEAFLAAPRQAPSTNLKTPSALRSHEPQRTLWTRSGGGLL